MDHKEEQADIQASVPAGTSNAGSETSTPLSDESFQGTSGASHQVLVDLLRQVEPLASEQPEDISRFFARLGEIHSLGLVEDRVFITRVLPFVRGGLLQFLGGCLRDKSSWEACKLQLLEEYFPHFVRERLIRDLIVFNFHGEGQPLRVYIDLVFQAVDFLQYEANKQQLVERVLMNLHPHILRQAAFLEKPRCRKELYRLVGLMEERFPIMQERYR
jgi:hypothetical protein